jgi:hypothetical protein
MVMKVPYMKLRSFVSPTDFRNDLDHVAGSAWLLLDGARFENIHKFIYTLDPAPGYYALYRETEFAPIADAGPFLLRVTPGYGELWSWFVWQGAEEQRALLLLSQHSLRTLASHFQQYLEARLPNLDVVLFRFYDPAIFHILAAQCIKPNIAAMLAPCSAVYWHNDAAFHVVA